MSRGVRSRVSWRETVGGGELVEHRKEMGTADTSDVEGGPLECAQHALVGGVKEVDAC
jgi:hypothetical protein